MKKQRYFSALIIFALSSACLFTGYWLGHEERQELAQTIVRNFESEQKDRASDTRNNLQMLIALKEGREDIVIELLTIKVKSGLRPIQPSGHEVADYLSGLSMPSESTIKEATKYQEKYCSDQCLGL